MSYPFPLPEKLRISNSSLNLFHSCERKLEFRKFYQNATRDSSVPGEVGHALHQGTQHFLQHRDRDAAMFQMMLGYPMTMAEKYSEKMRTLEACYATQEAIFEYDKLYDYQLSQVVANDGVTRFAVEVPFEITFKNFLLLDKIPVSYIGFIDLLLYWIGEQAHIVCDIKTHRNDQLKDRTAVYMFDPQCLPYAIVLEKMLGMPIENLTIKYLDVFVDIREPKVSMYTFHKSREMIEDWARRMYIDLKQLDMYLRMGWFPRRHTACVNFQKNVCKFFAACEYREPSEVIAWMKANKIDTTERPFTPWVELELELVA